MKMPRVGPEAQVDGRQPEPALLFSGTIQSFGIKPVTISKLAHSGFLLSGYFKFVINGSVRGVL